MNRPEVDNPIKARPEPGGSGPGESSGKAPLDQGRKLGSLLLAWFDENRRDLPWRDDRTPYRVWVSEIMLQQTRVDAVVPYYRRFLEAFPSIADLAAASETDVLKLWEGLGYYSRARNLHRAAREVEARYGGQLPGDVQALRELPGIGPYTAGAIASIAFNEAVPAVDGNVLRVVARLAGVEDVITTAKARRTVEDRVRAMMPPERPGDMTEALMELGALICLPRNPLCHQCPWGGACVALKRNVVEELPRRPERTPPRIVHGAVAVAAAGERVLVRRRPADGLLAGLWEFPWTEVGPGVDSMAALGEALAEDYGLRLRRAGDLPSVRHVFSHLEWRLDVFLCRVEDAGEVDDRRAEVRWADAAEVRRLPFGRAHRRIADAWLERIKERAKGGGDAR